MKSHRYSFPTAAFPKEMLLPQLFEMQAVKTPHHIAVYFNQDTLTYAQLNDKANALAHHLIAKGSRPGSLVGLCIERSCNLIVGVLGILKAGAGYVPLDPEYPQERLQYMMETAQMPLLITNKNLEAKLPSGKAEKILIENINS
jgi:non-ribosomal peptide synthetase component F